MSKGGHAYADLIAAYVLHNYQSRGITLFREVDVGTSIIGKRRRVDILVLSKSPVAALAVECKYQETSGTADEKIHYALANLESLRIPGCLTYAGEGWSQGVRHLLQGSEIAAYCNPDQVTLQPTKPTSTFEPGARSTWQLDHALALTFGWWDVIVGGKQEFTSDDVERVQRQPINAGAAVTPAPRRQKRVTKAKRDASAKGAGGDRSG